MSEQKQSIEDIAKELMQEDLKKVAIKILCTVSKSIRKRRGFIKAREAQIQEFEQIREDAILAYDSGDEYTLAQLAEYIGPLDGYTDEQFVAAKNTFRQ